MLHATLPAGSVIPEFPADFDQAVLGPDDESVVILWTGCHRNDGGKRAVAVVLCFASRCNDAASAGRKPRWTCPTSRMGDLNMSVDMREIYAAILEDLLDVKSAGVLAGVFSKAAVFRA